MYAIEGAKSGVKMKELNEVRKAHLTEYVNIKKGKCEFDYEELTTLQNIGPSLAEKLKKSGITTSSALKDETTEKVWDKLYAHYSYVGCVEIYAIEGAKGGIKVKDIDEKRKADLKAYVTLRKGHELPDAEELITLPNIGRDLANKLKNIGIISISELKAKTTEEVWDKLYNIYPFTGYIEMYSIECAKIGIKSKELDKTRKAELKEHIKKQKGE